MVFESDKAKNDEKPKGRPQRPMMRVAMVMIAVGAIGSLWSSSLTRTPSPTKTVITSYEVRTSSQQMTITTQNRTTTTTFTTAPQTRASPWSNYVTALLKAWQKVVQNSRTPK